MYKIFIDIYNAKIHNSSLFRIIDGNKFLADEIINFTKDIYLERKERDHNCLLNKKITIEILKSNYDIDNNNPDDNLRFLLGKCIPFINTRSLFNKIKSRI